jgi:uncharacterized protein
MRRFATDKLLSWLNRENRKPLVLRGARQVGKTWLVRDLARRSGLELIEINFEYSPDYNKAFESSDPAVIIKNLEIMIRKKIQIENTLLFLDEIQSQPELLAKLRWFREFMPGLAVIAAGSLLEFVLKDHKFSMPVGRINYFYIEPLSFLEFAAASGNIPLFEALNTHTDLTPLNGVLHAQSLELFKDYCIVGGMPEVVFEWYHSGDLLECQNLQKDLLATYYDDFFKYGNRYVSLLQKTLKSAAEQLGQKFVIKQIDENSRNDSSKKAIELLCHARLLSPVKHSSANGIPLGAESNEKFFKLLFLDTGLVSSLLGIGELSRDALIKLILTNKGSIAEQFAGQQIRFSLAAQGFSELFYWQRIGRKQGELDYIVQDRTMVLPVEVKSGSSGSMKSLHQFMYDKNLNKAVRLDLNNISSQNLSVKTTKGDPVEYTLISLPLYLAERIDVLIRED